MRTEAEIREAFETVSNGAEFDKWYAAWAEALEWVLS